MPSSVNLGEKLEGFIAEAIKNGRYGSRSEILREGVRLVQEREARWARFESEIEKGIKDVEAGRTEDAEVVFDRLIEKYTALAAKPRTFVGELRSRCISLSQQPNRFPSVGRVAGHPLRKLSHGNYLIFYLVSTDRVNIVRITHGSRDWSALLVDLQ